MSLYRKYRPLDFESLQGQDHIRDVLLGALKNDRVAHAYLFTGPRGTGKTSTARILARAINCLDLKSSGPCNECLLCKGALEESLTDLVEIDAASHGLVDDARALVEQARFMPTQSKKKIYIIDEVHMLSKSAFNALLKIIEEPPSHVHFILATTESHKVLDTIKSRCQRFDFHLADIPMIETRLKEVCQSENVQADDAALHLLAQSARGSFRDGLSLLEQVIDSDQLSLLRVQESLGLSEATAVHDFLSHLFAGRREESFAVIHRLHQQGMGLLQFCESILDQLRGRLLSSSEDHMRLLSWVEIFFTAYDQTKDSIIPELPLELAVLKCLQHMDESSSNAVPALTEKKPKKISTKQIVEPALKISSPETAKEPLEPESGFNVEKFTALIPSVSLRSLLKHSQLHLSGDVLNVTCRSQFEFDKIRESSNQSFLTEALQSHCKKRVQLHFEVGSEIQKSPLSNTEGLSNNDLQSVFS